MCQRGLSVRGEVYVPLGSEEAMCGRNGREYADSDEPQAEQAPCQAAASVLEAETIDQEAQTEERESGALPSKKGSLVGQMVARGRTAIERGDPVAVGHRLT
jgi:hypothetical protein